MPSNMHLKKLAKVFHRICDLFLCLKTMKKINIVVVGTENSGKTSIIRRYAGDVFYEEYTNPTTNVFLTTTFLELNNKVRRFDTEIIELSRQSMNSSISKKQAESASAFIFIYSITDENNLSELNEIIMNLQKSKKKPIFILRNKTDLDALSKRNSKQGESTEYNNCDEGNRDEKYCTFIENDDIQKNLGSKDRSSNLFQTHQNEDSILNSNEVIVSWEDESLISLLSVSSIDSEHVLSEKNVHHLTDQNEKYIGKEEFIPLQRSKNVKIFDVSAKDNTNISEAFDYIIRQCTH